MVVGKNRRTLKKRIRRVIFICIFITILLFSGTITFIAAEVFRSTALFVSEYFCNTISQEMNSDYFLKQLDLKGLEEFNPDSLRAKEWIDNLQKTRNSTGLFFLEPGKSVETGIRQDQLRNGAITSPKTGKVVNKPVLINIDNMVMVDIVLNGKIIYTTARNGEKAFLSVFKDIGPKPGSTALFDSFLTYFRAETSCPLFDSNQKPIGSVTARIDSELITILFTTMVVVIILITLLSLPIALVISRFFTLPIIVPLKKLDTQIRSLAAGDGSATMNAKIVLKRPLREIEFLAGSANEIMQRMKGYNDLLAAQKVMLENQNGELEAQNEELVESKRKIEETQTQLIQTENMASIGQLTAAITHEINTPLGAINSNVQICSMITNMLLENRLVRSDEELKNLAVQFKDANNISVMACSRVMEIIKSLKNFSRVDQAEYQETDINEGIKSVLVLTSNLWKKKITIHEEYAGLPLTRCFPGLLNQVFMNIIVNAIQAIKDKGDIYIKTYADENNVNISIRDTGCGIRDEHLAHIFEPGFTTKGGGLGMGLGLSISYNIVKKHNGDIKINTVPEKGTEFIISIPYAK